MIQIYTGDGKGKTTAAVGLAVRAVGAHKKVCFIQFMKGQETSEVPILRGLGVEVLRFGGKSFVDPKNPSDEDVKEAKKGLDIVRQAVSCHSERSEESGTSSTDWSFRSFATLRMTEKIDLLILDEILVAVLFKLISENDVIDLIQSTPTEIELVLTGRGATPKILELADLVTEMKCVKHPYEKGVQARKGIEY